MRSLTLTSPAGVRAAIGRASTDHWRLFDTVAELGDFAQANCADRKNYSRSGEYDFFGRNTGDECARFTRDGDLSRVAASDRLLERFERFAFETERKRWVDDVCGGFPNVPAFLSGHPLAMRRRIADRDGAAPVAVIVDLTTSAGISPNTIEKRGAAILALVRLLSMRRPVELWAGAMTSAAPSEQNLCGVYAKIETAPLDLATAAFVMTHPGFTRRLCYAIADKEAGYRARWPYDDHKASRANMQAICAQAFIHATETLCIPPAHMQDAISEDPEGWIEAQLARLAPAQLEAAE